MTLDSRIRLTGSPPERSVDAVEARALAFAGGYYPQGEPYRLLRLALHEIDVLRDELTNVKRDHMADVRALKARSVSNWSRRAI